MKQKTNINLIILISIITTCLLGFSTIAAAADEPDLIIESIDINCGGYLFSNGSNTISAVIKNNGSGYATASHTKFLINKYYMIIAIHGLNAGENVTVSWTDTAIRNAGDSVGITITTDYNDIVTESNDSNNAAHLDVTVVNNGYKGKTYTGGSNIATIAEYNLNGNLIYSTGDSFYLSSSGYSHWTDYSVTWTNTDLPVPVTAAVENARLYIPYTWDMGPVMPGDISLTFNGVARTLDTHYSDEKMYGTSRPYGMLVYDVTGDYEVNGNIANLTNSHIGGGNVSIRGMMLVTIYEDSNEPHRQIFVNEEFDLLFGGSSKCTTPDEATAWAPFTGVTSIDLTDVINARLITFAPGADESDSTDEGEGELIFNGHIWNDEWADNDVHQIGISDRDVKPYLLSNGNVAGFQSNEDYIEASNAILIVEYADLPSDLIVEKILINPQDERSEGISRVYVNANNVISAVVLNNGLNDITTDFSVSFEVDGVNIDTFISERDLAAGENMTIDLVWIPSCTDYPVSSVFPPQSLPLTITSTVTTFNSSHNLSKVIPAVQSYSTYDVIGGVVNNGYISKNFNCDTQQDPLDQFKYYSLTGGGVAYNVSGEKISTFATQDTDTRIHHIDLPTNATVIDARLYVYWYDKWGNYKTYPGGCLADLNVNFEGMDLTPEAVYQDSKGFGYYQSPKGNTVFNVTTLVSGSADYTIIVKNVEPMGGNNTTLLGEMLVVIYEGADHAQKVRIWMLEGTDYLMAADDTHGNNNYSVSPEMATATVTFNGYINLSDVDSTRLIAVAAQGMEAGSDLLFNSDVIKPDAWDTASESYLDSKINVEDISVMSGLLASGNTMGFRDNGTGGMQASNAILVVTGETENWRDKWMSPDSDEGSVVTTSELQDAIHHWLDDILVLDHQLTTPDLQEVIAVWLSG